MINFENNMIIETNFENFVEIKKFQNNMKIDNKNVIEKNMKINSKKIIEKIIDDDFQMIEKNNNN